MNSVAYPSGEKTLTARALLGLNTFLELRGVDSEEAASRFGFDWDSANSNHSKIKFRSFQNVLEFGAVQSGDDAFGLNFSQAENQNCTDVYHYILSNAATVREFLNARARNIGLVTNAYRTSLAERNTGATYTWIYPEETECSEQASGYLAGLLIAKIRQLFDCPDWQPHEVSFRHQRPRRTRTFEELFGSNVRFGANVCNVAFDLESLSRRAPNADANLFNALTTIVQTRTDKDAAPRADFRNLLRLHIARKMREGTISEAAIAKELGISIRSMQRRLAGLETTFRSQLNRTRKEQAMVLLSESDMAITDIAIALGFSELSAFSRAIKNWFGQTPSELRKAARDRAGEQ